MNIFYARATRFVFLLSVAMVFFGGMYIPVFAATPAVSFDTLNAPVQGENSNLGAWGTNVLAQSFVTGNTGGQLDKIVIQDAYVNPSLTDHDIKLYDMGGEGTIGSPVVSFGTSPENNSGLLTFTPTSTYTLQPNTLYWVVVKSTPGITWKYGTNTNTGDGTLYESMIRAKSTDGGSTFLYDGSVDAGGSYGTGAWTFNMKVTYIPDEPADTTAPTLVSISPADGATDVATTANIVLTFDEPVFVDSGYITLAAGDNDLVVENVSISGDRVSGSGTTTITIDPTSAFVEGEVIYVNVGSSTLKDASDNYFAGLTGMSATSFTVIDETAPVLTEVSSLSGKLPQGSDLVYRYTTNETCDIQATPPTSTTGSVEILAEEVIVGETLGITIQGAKPGGTYSFTFTCGDQAGNISNTLEVGPFTVFKNSSSTGGYATTESLAKSGVKLETVSPSNNNQNSLCPADTLLSYPVSIKKLQQHLARLGFNPGPIDGIRGPMTTNAIKAAQQFFGIEADGLVGPVTRGKINSSCK